MSTVLLVEDDPFLSDIYTTKLKEAGFKVVTVSDGLEVVKKVRESKPDILLLDIVLPGIDGWEVLRKIRKEEGINDLPVFVFSNLGQKKEVEKGLELGATRYLIKANYTPTQVVEEVQKTLKEINNK